MQDFILYKNSKVYFSSFGKGPCVVFLHGFLENSSMWNFVIHELKERNSIITIDLLGHGKTDCLGYIHTMEDMAAVVKAVLSYLNIRKITFIGHSMGGYVALAFAEKYPKCVRGLCLLNSTAKADTEGRKKLRDRANVMAKMNYENLIRMSVGNQFSVENRHKMAEEIEETKTLALQTSLQGYIATNEGMKIRKDRTHVLALAKFKKLFVVGKSDRILNYNTIVEEAQTTITTLKQLSGGHMSYIENREETKEILKEFITQN